MTGPHIVTTARLGLRELCDADTAFMVALLNDPEFIQFIGDRGVRNTKDATEYLQKGPLLSYRQHGYGMYLIERLSDGAAAGMCGLVRRDWLDAADLGFALLPAFRGYGFAHESSAAMIDHAFGRLDMMRLLAIAQPENRRSIALLENLGMTLTGHVDPPDQEIRLNLYELEKPASTV